MSNNDNISNIIAVVALVISIISFISTAAQVVQQYLASAEGYRRCAKSVMGLWANGTHRKFRKSELRFEVTFETPIIFLAPPENKRGPVPLRAIYNVDGTKQSYKDTQTMEQEEEKAAQSQDLKSVHTADDERASWVTLLATLQREEKESRQWDRANRITPRGPRDYQVPKYTVCVQVQKRLRSWDFMPPAVIKAFATTTICHLVEMTAMLGMYWKAFDPDSWNLRAEGNGFILSSSLVQGLGLMITFSVTGKSRFEDNRPIPCTEIKELSFGSVPSILKQSLNWGRKQDIVRTLEFVGCNVDTIEKYERRRTHLFSVSFEIIGMLGETFRIQGSNFKMIPNPTSDTWTKSFSAIVLMNEFQDNLKPLLDEEANPSSQLKVILHAWQRLLPVWQDSDSKIDIDLREVVHSAIKTCTAYLQALPLPSVTQVTGTHLITVIHQLADVDSYLGSQECNKESNFMRHYFNNIRPRVCGYDTEPGSPKVADASNEKKRERNDIWVTLMFRMCCWFLLHDFDKDDVFSLPSHLKGSRLPVYIY